MPCQKLLEPEQVFLDFHRRRIVRIIPQTDFEMMFGFHPYLSASAEAGFDVLLPPALLPTWLPASSVLV